MEWHLSEEYAGKTYIYGIGKQTEDFLNENPNLHVEGLLDGYSESGYIYGRPIVAIDSLAGIEARIIIVARKASEMIIYRRIYTFCKSNNIDIFNANGEIIKEIQQESDNTKCIKKILKEYEKYDVISFDIFDTLMIRILPSRDDLYKYMEARYGIGDLFYKKRINAENILSSDGIPNIYDIYQYMQGEKIDEYVSNEIEADNDVLVCNKEILEVYEKIVKTKPVYLVSDMYYSKNVLEKFLSKKGISGYKEIIVSSDYGMTKSNGLFDKLKEIAQTDNILHIGDSEEADEIAAQKFGIETIRINRIDTSRLYVCNRKPYDFGYTYLGPLICDFSRWIHEMSVDKKIDDLFFVSRDGYLIKQIYDMLFPSSSTFYLHTSRTQCVLAGMMDEKDILYAESMAFSGERDELLKKRFGLSNAEMDLIRRNGYVNRFDIIIEKSSSYRNSYLKYLGKFFHEKENRCAIIDFASSGTCHLYLEKITGKKFWGLYFEKIDDKTKEKAGLDIEGYTHDLDYFLLEPMIKELVPSLHNIDDKGRIYYCDDKISNEEKETIKEIQKGAVEYTKKLGKWMLDDYWNNLNIKDIKIGKNFLFNIINYDEFTGRKICY